MYGLSKIKTNDWMPGQAPSSVSQDFAGMTGRGHVVTARQFYAVARMIRYCRKLHTQKSDRSHAPAVGVDGIQKMSIRTQPARPALPAGIVVSGWNIGSYTGIDLLEQEKCRNRPSLRSGPSAGVSTYGAARP